MGVGLQSNLSPPPTLLLSLLQRILLVSPRCRSCGIGWVGGTFRAPHLSDSGPGSELV